MSEKTRTHLDIIESSICFVSAEMKEKEKRIKELEERLDYLLEGEDIDAFEEAFKEWKVEQEEG